MPVYRAWEIRTLRLVNIEKMPDYSHNFSFRNIERFVLYLIKSIVVGFVVTVVKYWFITVTKTKKWLQDKWPKIHRLFEKKAMESEDGLIKSYSFMRRTVLELRASIRRTKEKIRREHE